MMDRSTAADRAFVARLVARGYRRTSNRYGLLSRIDRDDWMEHMARKHTPWDHEDGMKWVIGLDTPHAQDHYRRVYSKDTIEIDPVLAKLVPSSCADPTGFVPE